MTGQPYAEVIGDPIGHSRSPAIHAFWLEKLGADAQYRATRVAAEDLPGYFEQRRQDPDWRGCNITIPHKQKAALLVDRLEDDGIGAINCVIARGGELIGRNTDAGGLGSALPLGLGSGDRVVLLGGGGAAAAAVAALKRIDVDCDLLVRQRDQGEALLARFDARGRSLGWDEAEAALAGCSGLVNASPLGMDGFPPMPEAVLAGLAGIRPGGFVLDMVYAPLRTGLLCAAERAGLTAIDGLEMLIGQAALAFSLFFGGAAPREEDGHLRSLLTR
jgi:shikimate dehydrogenase